jgi:putative acetyltransferase
VLIRPYQTGDAPALAALFLSSVREVGARDYSPAQVEAWAPRPPDPEAIDARARDGRTCLVAVNANGEPIAYGDLEASGHIDYLASALYERLEAAARRQGLARLFVEASEAARRLFLAKGFAVTGRRDFEIRGVPIHNYAMEKHLGAT